MALPARHAPGVAVLGTGRGAGRLRPPNEDGDDAHGTTVGARLVDAGLLTLEQAEQVLAAQQQTGDLFGRIAVSLGLVEQEALDAILAQQRGEPLQLGRDLQQLAPSLRTLLRDPTWTSIVETTCTQLLLRWFDDTPERQALAVIGSAQVDGSTALTAHLALQLAQRGRRVLAIDAREPHPVLPMLFGAVEACVDLRDALADPTRLRAARSALSNVTLVVVADRAAEVAAPGRSQPLRAALAGRAGADLIAVATQAYDAVLVDVPAPCDPMEAAAIAMRASGAVVVTRTGVSSMGGVAQLRDALQISGVELLGAVSLER